ncbi:MAG: protein kinase, partial [Myxococcota bacterium]
LNPDVDKDNEVAERHRDEARLLGMLRHRSIVWVDGLVNLAGRWTVVMEFVEGVNLKQLLKGTTVPLGCAIEIIQNAADAFHYAYARPSRTGQPLKLLHRDVKPSNIHLTPNGEVKVLDFGVARADFETRESVTRSLYFGSVEYMSPERLDGLDTHKGDVYALGAVLFELIVGEMFGRCSGNRERHNDHLRERLTVLWQQHQDRDIHRLLGECLAYDPDLRPEAGELARRLRGLRTRIHGPWLADWAEEIVPDIAAQRTPEALDDDLSGTLLSERRVREETAAPVDIEDEELSEWDDNDFTRFEAEIVPDAPSPRPVTVTQPPAKKRSSSLMFISIAAMTGLFVSLVMALILAAALFFTTQDTAEPAPQPITVAPERIDPAPAPEPPVEAAPEADADPVPVAADPAPDPQAASTAAPVVTRSEEGSVIARGATGGIRLRGGAGTFGPGNVPAGTYTLTVSFDGSRWHDSGQVMVRAAEQVTLICKENLQRCIVR